MRARGGGSPARRSALCLSRLGSVAFTRALSRLYTCFVAPLHLLCRAFTRALSRLYTCLVTPLNCLSPLPSGPDCRPARQPCPTPAVPAPASHRRPMCPWGPGPARIGSCLRRPVGPALRAHALPEAEPPAGPTLDAPLRHLRGGGGQRWPEAGRRRGRSGRACPSRRSAAETRATPPRACRITGREQACAWAPRGSRRAPTAAEPRARAAP